jgi:transposase
VNYKTAWRMGHEIRKYLGLVDGDKPLSGHVEVDEAYIGGKRKGKPGRGGPGKTPVMGMLERGGDIITRVVPDAKGTSLIPPIVENVKMGTTISTDDWGPYSYLGHIGYTHGIVNHAKYEWVKGIHHTQGIEGFWSLLKRSIKGTHVHVSARHLAKYLVEFEFRWNLRQQPEAMFPRLLEHLAT